MRVLVLTRQPRLHSVRRFRQACTERGIDMETMDVTRVAIAMHPRHPRLYYNGEEVDASRYDIIIPRIGTSVTEVGCSVVRQFEAMGIPVVNPSMGIMRARDKLRSMQVLTRLDVDIPKSMIIRRAAELDDALELVGGVPCVLKLLQGTQGVGVMLVESKDAIESVLQAFWSLGHTVLLQEFIKESKGKDVRAFVVGDKVVAAMRREAKLGEFRSNIHRGGLGRNLKLSPEEERVVVQAAKAMGLGIAGVDYLESKQGPKIIEVNSSPGFQGIEQATKADIAGAVIDYSIQMLREGVLMAAKTAKDPVIAGRRVKAGEKAQIQLKVSETVTHQPARIPITVVRGLHPGPTLFLTGAVHGDEINGVAIVREVLDKVNPESLHGTLVGIPVVNRFGFPTGDRYLPDRRDLNRSFPGSPDGSLAGRIADTLFQKVLKKCDAGIDLHTAAAGRQNLCHVRGDADIDDVRHMMRSFGTPIMMDGAGPKGALRRACTDVGIPTIIFEAGEPKRFQHHVVEIGRDGIFRVMKHLGMWKKRGSPKPGVQVLVKKSEWVRADHGGILDIRVEPGDLVRKGQKVAIIHDPFGQRVDAISAAHAGVVLGVATHPLTNPGEAIVHIGHLHKTLARVKEYVKEGGDMGHIHWSS